MEDKKIDRKVDRQIMRDNALKLFPKLRRQIWRTKAINSSPSGRG